MQWFFFLLAIASCSLFRTLGWTARGGRLVVPWFALASLQIFEGETKYLADDERIKIRCRSFLLPTIYRQSRWACTYLLLTQHLLSLSLLMICTTRRFSSNYYTLAVCMHEVAACMLGRCVACIARVLQLGFLNHFLPYVMGLFAWQSSALCFF